MPVKFSECTLGEMLLCTRDVVARGQIRNHLLANPTTRKNARLGVREAPFKIGYNAIVSRLLTKVVWVLEVELFVRPPYTR